MKVAISFVKQDCMVLADDLKTSALMPMKFIIQSDFMAWRNYDIISFVISDDERETNEDNVEVLIQAERLTGGRF